MAIEYGSSPPAHGKLRIRSGGRSRSLEPAPAECIPGTTGMAAHLGKTSSPRRLPPRSATAAPTLIDAAGIRRQPISSSASSFIRCRTRAGSVAGPPRPGPVRSGPRVTARSRLAQPPSRLRVSIHTVDVEGSPIEFQRRVLAQSRRSKRSLSNLFDHDQLDNPLICLHDGAQVGSLGQPDRSGDYCSGRT